MMRVLMFMFAFLAIESLAYRSLKLEKTQDVTVAGDLNTVNFYYLTVQIGSPKQSFNVMLDTGSSDLLIPAVGCQGCSDWPGPNKPYNPAASKSAQPVSDSNEGYQCNAGGGGQCAFDIQYQPCAVPNGVCEVAGAVYTDNVTLAGLTVNAPLGAISYLHNQRFAGVPKTIDGVLGLSYQGHNSVGAAPLFECLYRAGMLTHNMFSLCFGPNGGTLTLGGADPNMYVGPLVYMANYQAGTYFGIQMMDLLVNKNSIESTLGTGILDSGTTRILLPEEAFTNMQQTFVQNAGPACSAAAQSLVYGQCVALSPAQLKCLPTLTFMLAQGNGVAINMLPNTYLYQSANQYCFGISNGLSSLVLGAQFMQAAYVVHDMDNSLIGMAPANPKNCS